MEADCNEKALIIRAQNGDPNAQASIYLLHYQDVFKISCMILRLQDESHDIAQEVFYRVLVQNKIKNFRAKTKLSTWLFSITRNICISRLREKRHWTPVGQDKNLQFPVMETIRSKEKNPEEKYFIEKEADVLKYCLEQLPPLYRKCLEYWYFEDYSYREAAEKLGISRNYYGLCKLRAEEMLARRFKQMKPTECDKSWKNYFVVRKNQEERNSKFN